MAAWHGLIGKFNKIWPEQADFWMLIFFFVLFAIKHVYFFAIYVKVTKHTRILLKQEKQFIQNYMKELKITSFKQIEERDIYN